MNDKEAVERFSTARRGDPRIRALLEQLAGDNERGELRCIAAIACCEDGMRLVVVGETDEDKILGALERLKWTLLRDSEGAGHDTEDEPSGPRH